MSWDTLTENDKKKIHNFYASQIEELSLELFTTKEEVHRLQDKLNKAEFNHNVASVNISSKARKVIEEKNKKISNLQEEKKRYLNELTP